MSGPRSLAAVIGPITRRALGNARSAIGSLLADWGVIAGPELAARAVPERLSFPRGRRDGGELVLRVEPADALELQHDAPLVIERINSHYGYRAIERVRLIQVPRRTPAPPRPAPLDAEDAAALDAVLAGVGDPELRARLTEIGRQVYASDRRR